MRNGPVLLASLLLGLGSWSASLAAAELLPADKPIEEVIDFYVAAKLAESGTVPVATASDANIIRRMTLDLAGRIPTTAEVQAYVQSTEPDKRQKLVERLLASSEFPQHQRNEFDILLLPGGNDNEWRNYLLQAFEQNRPWDQMFREMMLGHEDNPAEKPALAYLKARANNLDDLTNDTSKLFFGVSVNCAKCHDHPLVLDWTQDHYFGMTSFFNRTYLNKRRQLGERDDGLVKFKTTEGEEKQAKLMFLSGAIADEPPAPELSEDEKKARAAKQKEDDNNKEGPPPAPPPFSRRAQLVELALKPENNSFFSRSIVNRIWARLLGRGLVMPLDQMHSANPASHPELLDWLSRDLVAHGYDLRRLVRGIVLSQPYIRGSRWEAGGEPPPEKLFAVGITRPLTPRQYALSLNIASLSPDSLPGVDKPEAWVNRIRDLNNHASGFAHQIEVPGENFQVSVSEALLFSNGPNVQNEYLSEGNDRLVGKLKTISDRHELIQTAFWAVLSRPAAEEELAAFQSYLEARPDRPVPALQQVVWALLTSSEFRFNY